jgi:hypothetical protein
MDIEDRILWRRVQQYLDKIRKKMLLNRTKRLSQSISLPLDEFLAVFEEDQDAYEQTLLT